MDDFSYWYGGAIGGDTGIGSIPPQAIPKGKKTDRWNRQCMDAFEAIGRRQVRNNSQFNDIFKMIEGRMSYQNISDMIPRYDNIADMLQTQNVDSYDIKHYDLIGIIINALAGELVTNNDIYTVTSNDDISTNDYIREKSDKLHQYVSERIGQEINNKLMQMGIDPQRGEDTFKNPEEYQQFQQQIEQQKAAMTPIQIEKYMKSEWKTIAAKWGNLKLEEDRLNFSMDLMDRKNFIQFLASGRCFRHIRVAYDYYEPEIWDVRNTFFSRDLENVTGQEGDYIGRIHKFTRSQVVSRYGSKLTAKQKEIILGSNSSYLGEDYATGGTKSMGQTYPHSFLKLQTVPFEGYYAHQTNIQLQNELGIPMGETKVKNRHGEYETVNVPLSPFNGSGSLGSTSGLFDTDIFNLRNDISVRGDLLTVTEVYWKSFKKIGYLTYQDGEGNSQSAIVTEDILPEFLTYEGIKKLKNKTIEDIESDPEPNSVVWDWIPEVYQGTKISGALDLSKSEDNGTAIYIDIKPCDLQIKGNGNIFDLRFPVTGIIGEGLGPALEPFQVSHNLAMNQMHNLMEKEIGLFYMFDIRMLPSEFKDWGDTTDTLLRVRDIAKDIGVVPVDSSKQNVQGGIGFNQFTPQNLSLSTQIRDRMETAEYFKNKAFEQVGITPQRLGAPTEYVTAEGVKASQSASYAQTEKFFTFFSEFKKNALEIQLSVAQYCQHEGKDLQLFYTQSDATQAFIKASDPDFPLRKLGLTPVSNTKKRRQLETFKQYLLNTNTMGSDELAIAELISSDTMSEIIEAASNVRLRREASEQQAQQSQQELLKQQSDQQLELSKQNWEREEASKQRDRENRIDVASISASGRAASNNSDDGGFKFIESMTKSALQEKGMANTANLKERELSLKERKQEDEIRKSLDNANLKMNEIQARLKVSNDNKYIAQINKN